MRIKEKIEELSEFDEVVKMPPKNKRRYLLIPKNKIIQTITAWRFPCYGKKVFYYRPETYEIDFLNILPITNTKKQLILFT